MEAESKKPKDGGRLLLGQQILHLSLISVLSIGIFILLQHYAVQDGEHFVRLKYQHLVLDLVCFVAVMILSELAAGNDFTEQEEFRGEGLTAAVLFLVLTALPPIAQESLESSEITSGEQFIKCALIIVQDDPLIGNDVYTSFFCGFFILNLVWAIQTAISLLSLKINIRKTGNSEAAFPPLLTTFGIFLATASLTTYIALQHIRDPNFECSYPHHQSSAHAYSFVLFLISIYIFLMILFARSYTVKVVRPILHARFIRKTKGNISSSTPALILPPLLTFILLFQFSVVLGQTDGVQGLSELFSMLAQAIVGVLSALQYIFIELIPSVFSSFWSLLSIFIGWLASKLPEGGLISQLILLLLIAPVIVLILKRALMALYRRRHYYPHILLLIMLILLAVASGFLFGLYLQNNNEYELIEIDTNRLTQ